MKCSTGGADRETTSRRWPQVGCCVQTATWSSPLSSLATVAHLKHALLLQDNLLYERQIFKGCVLVETITVDSLLSWGQVKDDVMMTSSVGEVKAHHDLSFRQKRSSLSKGISNPGLPAASDASVLYLRAHEAHGAV